MNLFVECLAPWSVIINQFTAHSCTEIYTSGLPTESTNLIEYLPFFLKTCVLEFPIYYLILYQIKKWNQLLFISVLLNLATHPFIFLGLPVIFAQFNGNYFQYLITAEVFAPIVEMLMLFYLFKIKWRLAFFSALLANLVSWTIGIYWI